MNKVYKAKRNAEGNMVAASELAKSHSSTVTKALAAVGLVAAAGAAQAVEIGSPQWIDMGANNELVGAQASTELRPALEYAIGDSNTVDGSAELRYTTLKDTKADGSAITAADLGTRKLDASGKVMEGQLGALAIGSGNVAQGGQSITIGFNNDTSKVSHEAMTVIGSDNQFLGYSEANLANKIENAAKRGVTLSREDAMLDNEGGVFVGDEMKIEISKSQVGIGHKVEMTGTTQNAVAIGDESTTRSSNQSVTIGRATKALDSHGAVSIGSTAAVTGAYGGVSIGVAALTDTANGVALGSFSEAHRAAIPSDKVSTFGEGASVAANQVYALHIANDQDKADIEATVKGVYGAVSVGNDKATRQITNVAAGTADSDAVNVAQLQATNNVVAKHEGDIINLGNRLTVAEGDINQLQVDVKAAKTEVKAGPNTTVTQTTGTNGQAIYTIDAKQNITNVAAGSNAVNVSTVTTTAGNTTTNNVKVDLSDRSKDAIDKALTALQEVKVNVNGQQVSTVNQSNPQVGFEQGKNIQLTTNSKGEVVVATKDVVDFKTVNVGPVKVDSTTGINAGDLQITGVKAGTAPTDAVNVSQLEKGLAAATTEVKAGVNTSVTQTKGADGHNIFTVSAKDTDTLSVAGSDAVSIKTGTTKTVNGITITEQIVDVSDKTKTSLAKADTAVQNVKAGDNIQVTKSGDTFTVATTPDVAHNSVTVGGNVHIAGDKVDMGGNVINNVAEGVAPTDAVNVSQLEKGLAAATTEVKAGENVTVTETKGADGQTIATVSAKDTTFKSVAASDYVTITTGSTTKVDGTVITEQKVDLSASVKSSLDKADTALQNIVAGDNIQVTKVGDTVTVATTPDVAHNSVTVGGNVHITGDKVDVGGNTINNVAEGKAPTDAVNVSQLEKGVASAKTEVKAGTHTTVTKEIGAAGQDIYTVNAKDTVVASGSDSVAVQNVYDPVANTTTSTVGLTQRGEEGINLAHSAVQTVETTIDGQTVNVITKDDNKQNFVSGKNVQLSTDVNGSVVVATTPDVDFRNVTADTYKAGDVTIAGDKVDVAGNQINNLAEGTKGTDAVNVNQLNRGLAAATTEVKAGENVSVTEVKGANGQAIYTVAAKDTTYKSVAASDYVTVTEGVTTKVGGVEVTERLVDVSASTKASLAKADTALQNVVAGDNIQVTKVGDTVTVATTPDVAHNSVTLGGKVVISGDVVNVAGNQISNVAEGTKGTDAVNVNQLNQAAAKATTEVVAGTHATVTQATGKNGQAIYTVNAKDTVVKAGSESVVVSNVFDAKTNTTTSTVGLTAKGEEGIKLAHSAVQTVETTVDGKTVNVITKDANKQNFVSGKNVKLSTDSQGSVVVATQDDVEFQNVVAKSFRSGDVHISASEVNAGGNKVTNVAPGTISATSTDAVNGSQLHQTNQNVANLDNKVTNIFGDAQNTMDKYRKELSAGIAGVNAAASLPQAHRAGQGSVAAAIGYYNGESALAVGVSSISDSGRWTVKGQANINTRGDLGAGVGVAYNF